MRNLANLLAEHGTADDIYKALLAAYHCGRLRGKAAELRGSAVALHRAVADRDKVQLVADSAASW